MQGYWTQFAATGNPNAPGDAGAPAWPAPASPTTDPYLELLDPTPMAGTGLRKTQCDFLVDLSVSVSAPSCRASRPPWRLATVEQRLRPCDALSVTL